ncbi:MAG: helix-turn-helix transcriptional regulator [Kiritimatiellae bacterium]|nr:helix-turn-helix transcriptional regulator [Kiritimatiellia bacterium]MBQ9343873.1 helix-turn-helix transcriptional regulator [Kiritimatiellia bacterium]
MEGTRKEIAARLKERRELEGVSVEEIAGKILVDAEAYRKYESGDEDIPASVLHNAAHVLGADLTELLTGEQPRLKIFSVTRKGKAVRVERRSDYKYLNLATNFVGRKADVFEVTVPSETEQHGSHANAHPGQEFNYVLEGRLRVLIHGNELILEPGDCVYFDAMHAHSMQALGGQPARFLAFIV